MYSVIRRWGLFSLLLLLAGAIVNVAVAWACALWSVAGELYQISPDPSSTVTQAQLQLFQQNGWSPQQDEGVRSGALHGTGFGRKEFFLRFVGPVQKVTATRGKRRGMGRDLEFLRQTYAGWPLQSLYCEEWLLDDKPVAHKLKDGNFWNTPPYELRYGFYRSVPVDFMSIGLMALPRPVPLRPVWLGFALNTVVYSAVLCVIVRAPAVLRRFIRRKRGLCPACAYPMGDSTICTECGKPLRMRPVA